MTKVLLIMYRKLMGDAMVNSLSKNPSFKLFLEQNYKNAGSAAMTYMPDIAVVEIPESRARHPRDYLKICTEIREASPQCKLLLMCPENSSESKHAAVDVMRAGEIDDFVYYNVSMDYLQSKLAVLTIGTEELYF